MLIIILATVSTNTAANIVSPTNDFQNLAPRRINHTRGVLLTGVIGIGLMGFELLKKLGWLQSEVSVESLYSNWLIGYSSLLGPIAGIMITDYFIVRRQRLDLAGLADALAARQWADAFGCAAVGGGLGRGRSRCAVGSLAVALCRSVVGRGPTIVA
jgi:cytosine/uracil/thiamine/allantoin permease